MPLLVCEGACNGHNVRVHDERVNAHALTLMSRAKSDLPPMRFRHTAHVDTGHRDTDGRVLMACVVCHAYRPWGWPPTAPGEILDIDREESEA